MLLENKVALITGGGRGIGRETALKMAREGANIAIADIAEDTMASTAADIAALGVEVITVKMDISDYANVTDAVSKVVEKFGKIDILVNNAAIFREAPFLEMTEADWNLTSKINLNGLFNVTRAVAPIMVANKDGRIISIASVDAFQGCTNYSHYAMAKAGVVGFSRTIAKELGQYNVRANCVAPGITLTDMTRDRVAENEAKYLATIPLNRIGRPEDIANATLFLSSDMSSYITGQVIHVNGGVYFG